MNKRLTGRDKGHPHLLKCFEGDGCAKMYTTDCDGLCEHELAAWERLAAYEDALPLELAQELAVPDRLGRLAKMPRKATHTVDYAAGPHKITSTAQRGQPHGQ